MKENKQKDRRSFSSFQTHIAYMRQSGLCNNCGGTLDYGIGTGKKYEKHHADGNHSNNNTENLTLLCKPCHMATLAKTDKEYKKRYDAYINNKIDIFDRLTTLADKIINKELSGAAINGAMEVINKLEKESIDIHNMNQGVFYPPPSIKSMIYVKNLKNEIEAMKDGVRIGMSSLVDILKEKKK